MLLRNTDQRFGVVSQVFHWVSSVMIMALLLVGSLMVDLQPPTRYTIYMMHKSTGLVLLVWLCARLIWTLSNVKPKWPDLPSWEKRLARWSHRLLYVLMLTMPLSGWMMATAAGYAPSLYGYGRFPMPWVPESKAWAQCAGQVHFYAAYSLVALLVVHIGAALKHHFIDKNQVLRRMLPWTL